jgi:hypothetical protein
MQHWVGYVIFEHWGKNSGSSRSLLGKIVTKPYYQPPILPNPKLGSATSPASIDGMIITIFYESVLN